MINDWLASINHADLADWVTVCAYLMAALFSFRAARHASAIHETRDRLFWRLTAVLLVFFAANELLDLQTLLTKAGRANAVAFGWYEERQNIQYAFVAGLGAAGALAGATLVWLTWTADAAIRAALAGLMFIGVFVLLRAASIHHINDLLSSGSPMFPWGSVQEVFGILIVGLAGALYVRSDVKQG